MLEELRLHSNKLSGKQEWKKQSPNPTVDLVNPAIVCNMNSVGATQFYDPVTRVMSVQGPSRKHLGLSTIFMNFYYATTTKL